MNNAKIEGSKILIINPYNIGFVINDQQYDVSNECTSVILYFN